MALAYHPLLSTKDIGNPPSVMTCVMPLTLRIAILRLKQGSCQHAIETILQIALQRQVNTIVATSTLVDQCTVLIEQIVIQDRVGGSLLYGHVEQPLPVRLNLQHGILAQTLGKRC